MAKGRPHKLTPEVFDAAVDELIRNCEDTIRDPAGYMPDDYTLCNIAHIGHRTLERYYQALYASYSDNPDNTGENKDSQDNGSKDSKQDNYKIYGESLKRLVDYRSHWYSRKAITEPRIQSFCIFAAKQRSNGGWTDRQVAEANGDVNVKVSITGAKGGEEAFK